MPENKTISCSFIGGDQAKKNNATSQALVLFGAPKEAIEIFHENKMTNTEGVNEGIYFSYPCRRQSCALVNIPAPCVNKMISHIENVESKIQEHLKRVYGMLVFVVSNMVSVKFQFKKQKPLEIFKKKGMYFTEEVARLKE